MRCSARRQAQARKASWTTPPSVIAAARSSAGALGADLAVPPEKDERADQHDVEERLRKGGGGEAADAVQRAAEKRRQRDQQQIGKGDRARSMTARSSFAGSAAKPGASASVSQPMAISATTVTARSAAASAACASAAKRLRRLVPSASWVLVNSGTKAEANAPSAKSAAEEVGQALRDEEGVGDRPGAERGGDEDVADEAQHAA